MSDRIYDVQDGQPTLRAPTPRELAAPSGSRTCHDCKHCGKPAGPYIRCEHPALVASCEPDAHDMREFAPDFAQECDDFENEKAQRRRDREASSATET